MWVKFLVSAAVIGVSPGSFAQTFSVRGGERTCADIVQLDKLMASGRPAVFNGWSAQDFEAARTWAAACVNYGWQFSRTDRVARLDAAENRLSKDAAIAARNIKIAQQQAAAQAEREAEARRVEERNRQAAEDREARSRMAREVEYCRKGPAYLFYFYENLILELREQLESVRAAQRHEREVATAGGVRDLAVERANGEELVQVRDNTAAAFAEYRSRGGKAKTPTAVRKTVSDPCPPYPEPLPG